VSGAPATLILSGSAALVGYNFVLNGAVSSNALNGLLISLPESMSGALTLQVVAAYSDNTAVDTTTFSTVYDHAFRHLFNLDGLSAVLHFLDDGTDVEIWVGNANGASMLCARGFSVAAVWFAGELANLTFTMASNGSIGDLLFNDVPLPPASSVDSYYFGLNSACTPVSIDFQTSAGQLWVGGSGTLGYDDNWMGIITFVGLDFVATTYNVSAARLISKKGNTVMTPG
jgi:hypothetical protein